MIIFSFIFCFISLVISYFVVPFTQNKARSFIRSSNLDFFPSLIKQRKFIDTVEKFTIFIDKKNQSSLSKVLIKDASKDGNSQLIISKSGKIVNTENEKFIQLNDGIIINYGNNNNLNSFNFKKTNINLDQYKTKTTTYPKIQEISSSKIFNCIKQLYNDRSSRSINAGLICDETNLKIITQEFYKRIILPFYIPLITIIASFLCIKSSSNKRYGIFKTQIFLIGILIIILSQISINIFNIVSLIGMSTLIIPLVVSILSYYFFLNKTKNSS